MKSPRSKPKPQSSQSQEDQNQQPEPLNLGQKLEFAQQSQERWDKLSASPDLSPQAAAWAREQAVSAQSAVRLYQKAQAYQAEQASQFTVPADQPSARRPQHSPSIPVSVGLIPQ